MILRSPWGVQVSRRSGTPLFSEVGQVALQVGWGSAEPDAGCGRNQVCSTCLLSTSDQQAGGRCSFLGSGPRVGGQAGHASSSQAFANFASACTPMAKVGSLWASLMSRVGKVTPPSSRRRQRRGCGILPQGSEAPSWKFNLPHRSISALF